LALQLQYYIMCRTYFILKYFLPFSYICAVFLVS
jgi:hypothetical protein